MGEFSISHILILTLILLLFFGPSRLPALGQSLGKAIRGFKDGINEANADVKEAKPALDEPKQAMNAEEVKEVKKDPHS